MKHKIVIIGGSLREQIVADMLKENGFFVRTFATENTFYKDACSLGDSVRDASALILPVRCNREDLMVDGTSDQCPILLSKSLFTSMKKGAFVYCGIASNALRNLCMETGHPLCEIMEYDKVAVPNGILTAEGTLAYVLNDTRKALKEINISVFGYGRVGKACADLFSSVGCNVIVFCRSEDDMRKGRQIGIDMRYYNGCPSVLPKTDYLINTVPAQIIDEKIISFLNRNGKIIDLASFPGGVDGATAEAFNIPLVMLPGIPGKHAPLSAGKILGEYYLNELKSFAGGGQ